MVAMTRSARLSCFPRAAAADSASSVPRSACVTLYQLSFSFSSCSYHSSSYTRLSSSSLIMLIVT